MYSGSIGSDYVCSMWYYSIYLSVLYIIAIFSIQKFMETKKRLELRLPLFCWNLGLCIFSVTGAYMTAPVHFNHLFTNGITASICGTHIQHGSSGIWSLLFILSKAPELVDTFFIVLRKQKLIFLHWYHHITVFIYCWYNYCLLIRSGQWFIVMNYMVHAVMYGYYALRVSRVVKLPIWVNMVITMLQLLQMIVGVAINIYVYMHIQTDWVCDGRLEKSYFYVLVSFAMYFSYFVLFALFFYDAYFSKSPSVKSDKVASELKPKQNGKIMNGAPIELGPELRRR